MVLNPHKRGRYNIMIENIIEVVARFEYELMKVMASRAKQEWQKIYDFLVVVSQDSSCKLREEAGKLVEIATVRMNAMNDLTVDSFEFLPDPIKAFYVEKAKDLLTDFSQSLAHEVNEVVVDDVSQYA